MNAALMTILLVTGAGPYDGYGGEMISPVSYHEGGGSSCASGNCGEASGVCINPNRWWNQQHERLMSRGSMPQTCYSPRYGCYSGNGRDINRYPAFHGTFYRRPYNYRNVFDYPWHAEPHEPTSMFSFNVPAESTGTIIRGEALPLPISARRVPTHAGPAKTYQAAESSRRMRTAERSVIQQLR